MVLQYYVIESATGKHINIEVDAASKDDLEITRSGWQTVWDTDFILDPQKEKYVAKTEEGGHYGFAILCNRICYREAYQY